MSTTDWRMMFEGRQAELDRLIAAWELAKSGKPQFLVLLGDTGLGKTRLVHEFYRWLSRHEDEAEPGGYWPDAFTIDTQSEWVNPDFADDFRPAAPIPYLWWGIRFAEPTERNPKGAGCGLADAGYSLKYHVEPLVIARQKKQLTKEAAWKTMEIAGGSVVGIFFALKSAKELLALRSQERELDRRSSLTPAEHKQAEQQSLADLALDAFETTLNPKIKEARTVPVVIVLDDAQWADPDTLAFVERLFARAHSGGWPLLLLATHWEKEWREYARMIAPSAGQAEYLSQVFDRLAPGNVPAAEVLPIAPLPDLSAVVEQALPGLSDDNKRLLLEKAGGNPLLLRQLLDVILLEPALFENEEVSRDFTGTGAKRVRELRTERRELIGRQFAALPGLVKKILGWSSYQGERFLAEITARAAATIRPAEQPANIETALAAAEDPYAIVEHGRASAKLSQFRQAVFYEIAREHLALADRETETLRGVVRASLRDWVLAGGVQAMPAEERRDVFLMAARELQPQATLDPANDHDKAWARAMLGLIVGYRDEYLWEQACDAARTLVNALGDNDAALLRVMSLPESDVVFKTLYTMRDLSRALRVANANFAYCRASADALATPEALRDLSASLDRVGDVQMARNRWDEALKAYDASLEICRRLLRDHEQTPQALRDLSVSLIKVGDVQKARNRWDEALKAYDESLEICRRLLRDHEQTPQALRDLSVSLERVGDVQMARNRWDEALKAYDESLEICRRLLRDHEQTPQALCDLSRSLVRVGDVQMARNRWDEALKAYDESLEICRRLLRDHEQTPQALRDLSVSLERVGDVQLARNRWDEAPKAYDESLEIRRRLLRDHEQTPQALRDLSVSLIKVGDVQKARNRWDEALKAYDESLEICRRLLRDHEQTPQALRDLSVPLERVGDVQKARNRWDEALKAYDESLEFRRRLLRDHEQTPQALCDLSRSLVRVGDVQMALNRWAEALKAYDESLEFRRRLLRDHEQTPQALRDVGVSLFKIGIWYLTAEDRAVALGYFKEARTCFQTVLNKSGETPLARADLETTDEFIRQCEDSQ